MTTDTAAAALLELDRAQCLSLLGSVPIGRLVHTRQALPAVTPVTFALQPDGIYLRTPAEASVLSSADGSTVVAFQADEHDAEGRYGWSVVVLGRAHRVTDPLVLARLPHVPLWPWAGGEGDQVVRVPLELVSGHRAGGRVS